jgi:hypothetical protein
MVGTRAAYRQKVASWTTKGPRVVVRQRLTQGLPDISWVGDALMGEISTFVKSRNRRAPRTLGT